VCSTGLLPQGDVGEEDAGADDVLDLAAQLLDGVLGITSMQYFAWPYMSPGR
jgi:hypothetical protein